MTIIKMIAKMMSKIAIRPSIMLPMLLYRLIIALFRNQRNSGRCSRGGRRGRRGRR